MVDLNDELAVLEDQQAGVVEAISHLTKMKADNPEIRVEIDNLIDKLSIKQK